MVGLVHGRRDRTRSQAARASHGTRDRTDISAPNGYSGLCSIVNPVGFDRHTRLSATVLVRDGGGVYQGHGAADMSSLLQQLNIDVESGDPTDDRDLKLILDKWCAGSKQVITSLRSTFGTRGTGEMGWGCV